MTEVSLNITVDADGATDEQLAMYREMAALFEERFETFVSKNLDYGSSFLTAGEVDMALDTGDGPFDTALEANLYKLFTRLQDKDQRFYNLVFCGGDDHVGEPAAETAGDAAVYWFMVEWLLRHGGRPEGEVVGVAEYSGDTEEVTTVGGPAYVVDEETGEIPGIEEDS